MNNSCPKTGGGPPQTLTLVTVIKIKRCSMSYRPALRTTALVALLAGIPGASVVFVQQAAPSRGAAQKVGNAWQPPRTAWGHPDLQGLWASRQRVGGPGER